MDLIEQLESIEGLRAIDRTVSAQAIDPTDNGTLKYAAFFPPVDVKSTVISELVIDNYRPVASRREWNGPDRLIPLRTPTPSEIEIIPVGDYYTVGEKELQRLEEIYGEEEAILREVGGDIESRTDGLVEAGFRRVEADAFTLWATGMVQQDDPTTGHIVETDFGFDADRLQIVGTAWTSGNFHTNALAWLADAKKMIGGSIEGVVLSEAKRALWRASFTFPVGITPSYVYMEQRIAEELGVGKFRFALNDDTADFPVNGGTRFESERIWPLTHLAAIPAGGKVGRTVRPPQAGLGAFKRKFAEAEIDRNGALIAYDRLNSGKGVKVRGMLLHMSIPNEGRVATINVG